MPTTKDTLIGTVKVQDSIGQIAPRQRQIEDIVSSAIAFKAPAVNAINGPRSMVQPEMLAERSPEYWTSRINELANEICTAVIKAGQALNAAKEELGHGNFRKLFGAGRLRIDQRSAQMMM